MQRDYDLVLKLLEDIEGAPPNTRVRIVPEDYPDHDEDTINEHLELMISDAGLVAGHVMPSGQARVFAVLVERLTWQGHDFLDAARVPGVWDKATEKIKAAGGNLPFEIVKSLVIGFAKEVVLGG